MEPVKELKLRLRFYRTSPKSIATIKQECELLKLELAPDYHIKILDNHIWFSIGVLKREKYSPQLHIELEKMEDGNTALNGLFGPDPVLWTMFMFLHFIVAGIFITFGLIAYSKWSLNQKYTFDLIIMGLMICTWGFLYYFARRNRKKGIPQMRELEELVERII
jgi:hypothetical protein